ncbi:hypothetical protein KVG29_11220 [Caldicoprobacter algeriensis]|uniref:hypothetical protein n=1 Tax=Caldicoprobacter algeriensis TaxID=699281 RepID=UPI002079DBC2|nr:hypothetical protein [Caldicoprobacter algeriensis]MCM8901785.1 hypothetical protein [Caldicoprobacter algeriensis]
MFVKIEDRLFWSRAAVKLQANGVPRLRVSSKRYHAKCRGTAEADLSVERS